MINLGIYDKIDIYLKPKLVKLTMIFFKHQGVEHPFESVEEVSSFEIFDKFTEEFSIKSAKDFFEVMIYCSDSKYDCMS